MEEKPAPSLGKYQIVRELGRGGMGVVYEATDSQLRRRVALKMLLSHPSADPRDSQLDEERFLREAQLSAKLAKHPNVVSVYEAGVIDGKRYLAMEYIDGKPFALWRKTGSVPLRQQIRLLRDVAVAVHHAHRHQIIHRDLKPDNILVDPQGQPHVTDFGLAKSVGQNVRVSLTASGMVMGTPAYMSPEQALGEKTVDQRTDVYAIGVMLYEVLTGRLPFFGETAIEILVKAANSPVPPPSSVMPPGTPPPDRTLELLCLKSLAKDPRERYPTAEAMANDLTRWLNGQDVKILTPKTRHRATAATARPTRTWMIAAAAAVLVVVGIVWWLASSPGEEPATTLTPHQQELERKKAQRREAERLLGEGQARLKEGKNDEATRQFDEVLRLDPGNAAATAAKKEIRTKQLDAEMARADGLMKDGKYRDALLAYGRIVDQDPGHRAATAGIDAAQRKMEEAIARAKDAEIAAKSEADRKAAEQKRKEEEEANRKTREELKDARKVNVPSIRDASLTTLVGHGAAVWGVAFSPDGRWLATGSVDKTIRIWDVARGAQSNRIVEGSGVLGLAFSRDGRMVASGGVDGVARIWEPATGREIKSFTGHQKGITRISISPDGKMLATASPDNTIRLWDIEKGTTVRTFPGTQTSPQPQFLAKGGILAGATQNEVRFWDLTSGKEVRPPLLLEGLTNLALSPDGSQIAVTSWNNGIGVWNAETGKAGRTLTGHTNGIWAAAFTPDARLLASGSADRTLKLWDVVSGKEIDTLIGHAGVIYGIAISPDGKLLASGCEDGSVKLWNIELPAPEAAWSKAVDLLALVDPKRDTLRGAWRKEGGKLIADPSENAVLRLPYEPPEEYDFRIVFTRKRGMCATVQFFTHQGHPGVWDINSAAVGFSKVGGVGSNENATRTVVSVQDGVQYVSVVQVRRDRVKGWIDGGRRSEWSPAMGELSSGGAFAMDLPALLGIGNCDTHTTFDSVQVLELTGKGKIRTTPAAPPAAKELPPDPYKAGLAAHWKMNDGLGATAADVSGKGVVARVIGGAQWVAGKTPGLRLDGATGYVELADGPLEKLRDSSYALALWYKPDEAPREGEQKNGTHVIARMPWFTMYYLPQRSFMMQHALAGGEKFGTCVATENTSPPGSYYHVVGVVDKAEGTTKLYVDGELRSTSNWPANSGSRMVWLGAWVLGANGPAAPSAKGTMDTVRVYERALGAPEIQSLYKSELNQHPK